MLLQHGRTAPPEKGYVLKVPQPWPDRQDEELREKFSSNCELLQKIPTLSCGTGMKRELTENRNRAGVGQ